MSRTIKESGATVRLPKGQSRLNSHQVDAVHHLMQTRKGKTGAGCTVILFKGKTKHPVAVSRCEGSTKLTGDAAVKRGKKLGNKWGEENIKKVCHKKNGKFAPKGAAGCTRK